MKAIKVLPLALFVFVIGCVGDVPDAPSCEETSCSEPNTKTISIDPVPFTGGVAWLTIPYGAHVISTDLVLSGQGRTDLYFYTICLVDAQWSEGTPEQTILAPQAPRHYIIGADIDAINRQCAALVVQTKVDDSLELISVSLTVVE